MVYSTTQQPQQITIRPFDPDDAASVFEAIDESRVEFMPWMPDLAGVPSVAAVREWIEETIIGRSQGTMAHWAIIDAATNTILGGCGLTTLNTTHRFANLYYWVRSNQTGRGIATAATRILADWGFEHFSLQRVEIVVAVGNDASMRVAEKAGALREGLVRNRLWMHDRSYDAIMFSLIPKDLR